MNYPSALRYLHSFLNFERVPFRYHHQLNLERMKRLLDWFAHPETSFSSVLIAGTKGKGSTAIFLASMLSAHGHAVGLFTSPHLSDPRERIQMNGRMISPNEFARVFSEIKPVIENRKHEIIHLGVITYFEMFTLAAMIYFARQKADFAVFEVGMGGRLDATNVLQPLVSVITPISYDHEEHLGMTLSKIAAEKAAIIKDNGHVVVSFQEPEAERTIRKIIRRKRAKGFFYGPFFRTAHETVTQTGTWFDFKMGEKKWDRLETGLTGKFQIQNAAGALAAACCLEARGCIRLNDSEVRQGLKNAFWPGRFEIVRWRGRTVVLDGAHNDASMRELCGAMKTVFPGRKYVMIFGSSREKNLERIFKEFLTTVDLFIATKSRHSRAQEPKIILEKLKQMNFKKPNFWTADIYEALKTSCEAGLPNRVILITGSLFLVGEARNIQFRPKRGSI